MPPRNELRGRRWLVPAALSTALLCGISPVAGQDLQLRREYPGSAPFACPAPSSLGEVGPDERAQASQLASEAGNASILGDFARAEQLLAQAADLDPASADVAYQWARVLETLDRPENAMLEYCRAMALGAQDVGILDSQARLDALDEELRARISPAARQRFSDGLTQTDLGLYDQAVRSFTNALDEIPEWPEAVYNRAVVLERMGLVQESLEDYRAYLAMRPANVDPLLAGVASRIGLLEGMVAAPTPSPGNTLAFGVIFPGMGQYYTGRNSMGTIVLGAAVGAVAAGFFVKEVTIRCLQVPPSGSECPPSDIVDETTDRPYLAPALGVAAAVTIGAAVEAWLGARRRRADQEAGIVPQDGVGFAAPSISTDGERLDLNLLTLRFR